MELGKGERRPTIDKRIGVAEELAVGMGRALRRAGRSTRVPAVPQPARQRHTPTAQRRRRLRPVLRRYTVDGRTACAALVEHATAATAATAAAAAVVATAGATPATPTATTTRAAAAAAAAPATQVLGRLDIAAHLRGPVPGAGVRRFG